MTGSSGTGLSKGMRMIAAYRAERLSQRPGLRVGVQPAHAAGSAAAQDGLDQPPPQAGGTPAAGDTLVHDKGGTDSVFARMVNGGEAHLTAEPGGAVMADVAAIPAASAGGLFRVPAYDPPLAEMGFGPGMLIRLSQIGLRTAGDMARADPAALRAELGEISRLVDVEAWIRSARQTASSRE